MSGDVLRRRVYDTICFAVGPLCVIFSPRPRFCRARRLPGRPPVRAAQTDDRAPGSLYALQRYVGKRPRPMCLGEDTSRH